jgi:hypothetical protein
MSFDAHERARFLIDESRIAGIPAEDSGWLRTHLTGCEECARQEAITARMLGAMDQLDFAPPRSRRTAWRWPLAAAAAAILLAAIPIYKSARDSRQAEADEQLLNRVGEHVSRAVPQALEPLVNPTTGDPQ